MRVRRRGWLKMLVNSRSGNWASLLCGSSFWAVQILNRLTSVWKGMDLLNFIILSRRRPPFSFLFGWSPAAQVNPHVRGNGLENQKDAEHIWVNLCSGPGILSLTYWLTCSGLEQGNHRVKAWKLGFLVGFYRGWWPISIGANTLNCVS